MSEMIERVARAMQCVCEGDLGDFEIGSLARPHQTYIKCARAAIEAMREPTATMSDAGEKYCDQTDPDVVWRIMINAALGNVDA